MGFGIGSAMPTYSYLCHSCSKETELIQKITEPSITKCSSCLKETLLRRPAGGIGISFKGPGFYVNDYPNLKKKRFD